MNFLSKLLNGEKVCTILRYIFRKTKIKIQLFLNQITIPNPQDIPGIRKENHDSVIGGHRGFHGTLDQIRAKFRWPNMSQEIFDFVRVCPSFQTNKFQRRKKIPPMQISHVSERTF